MPKLNEVILREAIINTCGLCRRVISIITINWTYKVETEVCNKSSVYV